MERLSLCVSSQTPLVRFNSSEDMIQKYVVLGPTVNLANLVEGEDYEFTAGGVTRMIFPLLKMLHNKDILINSHWVSLNPIGPEKVTVGDITLDHVNLARARMAGYGKTKETMWQALHGIEKEPVDLLFWQDEFADYTYYNRLCSELVTRLDKENEFDLFYIQDFQQLLMGRMLRTLKPKIFRWHIPFDESLVPEIWKQSLTANFNAYDVVIASCKKYINSLNKLGYAGTAYHIYPYIDRKVYRRPSAADIERFNQKFELGQNDRIVLVVARLDPMKGQDRAIKAFAKVAGDFRNLKLVIAGNGSFSSSKQGIGLSKAERWLGQMRELAKALGAQDRVIFTGHLNHKELQAAYERCELTILPSILEGFGLVVIESWLYRKPTIVSNRAGVAELVKHGENGLLFNPDDSDELAGKLRSLLLDADLASTLGENGYRTSRICSLEKGAKLETEVMLGLAELPER